MAERVIPIVDQRTPALAPIVPLGLLPPSGHLADSLARPLRDLRISVTDRCNFRCGYCMPKTVFDAQYRYLPQADLLRFEEITRLARLFLQHGVQKIRLTGGEPLLRKGLEHLIAQLAQLRTVQGRAPDLTLTTNGALLARKARALRAAGLQRVTVSLDSLDDATFRRMNDVDFPVAQVLDGIAAAQAAGLQRIKVNMVVQRGTNDHQIVPMARHFRGTGIALRFIEYMDVGSSNGWRMEQVLPSAEVLARLQAELALVPLPAEAEGETAQRWGWANAHGHHDPAQVKLASSAASPKRFAAAATVRGCPRKASCTCACSPRKAGTCANCCAARPAMPTSPTPWQLYGTRALTAIRSCVLRLLVRPPASPGNALR